MSVSVKLRRRYEQNVPLWAERCSGETDSCSPPYMENSDFELAYNSPKWTIS